jgi:signal transduction histidine kinase
MVADMGWLSSVKTRTSLGAMVVVAIALLIGAAALVFVVRDNLQDAAETAGEHRAKDLAAQIKSSGPPQLRLGGKGDTEPDDVVWQIFDENDVVVSASQALLQPLPDKDEDIVVLPGEDDRYYIETKKAKSKGERYLVIVAVSLDDVDDATEALIAPLAIGLPLLLAIVGVTTWLVASRALNPVERIRREVELITGASLDRRVFEPLSGDEIERLARTMNQMLGRVQESRDRQQQFVADASHELRSPLASLRQAAEVVHAHPGAMDEGELAETVLAESVRMQQLVDQLLLLTRNGEGRAHVPRVDVDVDDLALTEASRIARTGLSVDTTGVAAGRVHGDAIALGQVVRNLMDNAARHAHEQVRVAVRDSGIDHGNNVAIIVEDDGPGIPESDRQRVFERFVRLDEARARDVGGSGLGLAIVREVVAGHGGSVEIDDSPLGGARFTVLLPA